MEARAHLQIWRLDGGERILGNDAGKGVGRQIGSRRMSLRERSSGAGEFNAEERAVVGGEILRFNGEMSAVGLTVSGNPETDTGADVGLGGEERIEDARQVFGRDAVPVIEDGDGGSILGAGGFDADGTAGIGKRVAGVRDEVGEDLAEVVAGDGKAEVFDGENADFSAAGSAAGLKHGDHGVNGLGDIDGARRGAGTDEGEGAAGDGAEAGNFLVGALEVVAGFVGEVGIGFCQIDEVSDGLERVVDLVGDGGGEAADSGELFGADQSRLGILALGDVDGDAVPDAGIGG